MKHLRHVAVLLASSIAVLSMLGCGSDKANPISGFEPEIINDADAFQFQVTNATNVSVNLSYEWQNTGAQATINHSTALDAGTATVTLFDADATQMYQNGLLASGTHSSATGTPGTWTVRVSLVNFSGTVNFRVEKL
ncbi:MAG TPA: hypothetical protein VN285_04945 [Candidatus Deferrimicrobium sp.]|nr:hypothetical protein [Candidatus Deferrimicrobium sp.]